MQWNTDDSFKDETCSFEKVKRLNFEMTNLNATDFLDNTGQLALAVRRALATQ